MFLPIIIPLASRTLKDAPSIPVHFVRETYVRKLSRYGLTPLFVPQTLPRVLVDSLYTLSCGALFLGGGDFDAKYYGQKNHPKNFGLEPRRDKLELYLLKKILKDRKPFLGICRGCQALAIASGGSLIQNIDSGLTTEKHQARSYNGAVHNKNRVLILPNTQTGKYLKKKEIRVTCAHHQSILNLGKYLRIVGKTPGGVVEIIEHKDPKFFCIGIQSHPELINNGPLEPIFKAFSAAVKKYTKTL